MIREETTAAAAAVAATVEDSIGHAGSNER